MTSNRQTCCIALLAALLVCAGCSRLIPPAGAPPAVASAGAAGPFLYVGGHRVAMFALGSSKPLHVTKSSNYSYGSGLALDLHGHLCVSTGNPSYQAIYAYDARTLKLLGETDLAGYFSALVADRYGYLYASSVFGILVYAPGCTQRVNNLRHGGRALVFDRSGNLYASLGNAVGVYEPEQRRGHMRFVRRIHKGLKNLVSALAIGPSDDLFVADEIGRKGGYVAVYRRGGSDPVEKKSRRASKHPNCWRWIQKGDSTSITVRTRRATWAGDPAGSRCTRLVAGSSSGGCVSRTRLH